MALVEQVEWAEPEPLVVLEERVVPVIWLVAVALECLPYLPPLSSWASRLAYASPALPAARPNSSMRPQLVLLSQGSTDHLLVVAVLQVTVQASVIGLA